MVYKRKSAEVPWRTMNTWDAWETFLHSVLEDDHGELSAILSDVGIISIHEGLINIALAEQSYSHARIGPELCMRIERLATRFFGEIMKVEINILTPSIPKAPSLILMEKFRITSHRKKIIDEVHHEPVISSLISTFSGKIDSIDFLAGISDDKTTIQSR